MAKNPPIGIFDSGVGGLTVLRQLVRALPNESFIYYADTTNAPYGDKPVELLDTFNTKMLSFFSNTPIKCLVSACNTSSALFDAKMKKALNIPVFNLIDPAIKQAVQQTRNNRVAVLATMATVNSRAYEIAAQKTNSGIQLTQVPCPKLVKFIEKGDMHSPHSHRYANDYLDNALKSAPDILILGCSHYPFYKSIWTLKAPSNLIFLDPAVPLSEVVKTALEGDTDTNNINPAIQFVTTGPNRQFNEFVENNFNFGSITSETIREKINV